jgi:glycosyltransferase involved in cell wall biosynthesis
MCLESILAQTYKHFELLIIDDCSTDHTIKIAQEYAAKDVRITVFKNEKNLGLVGNWNRCVELAKGEWIKFVFQDDVIYPTCLEKMMQLAHQGNAFVYSARDLIWEADTPPTIQKIFKNHQKFVQEVFKTSTQITAKQFAEAVIANPFQNLIGEPTFVLLKKELFSQFGFFEAALIQICDSEYWNRIGTNIGAAYVNEVLGAFRVHGNSATANNRKKARLTFEVLIYLHCLAFSPYYKALRGFAKRSQPPENFKKILKARAQRIYWKLRGEQQQEILDEWSKVTKLYPVINKLSKPTLYFYWNKIKARLKYSLENRRKPHQQ